MSMRGLKVYVMGAGAKPDKERLAAAVRDAGADVLDAPLEVEALMQVLWAADVVVMLADFDPDLEHVGHHHLVAGWVAGQGMRLVVLRPAGAWLDILLPKIADDICRTVDEVLAALGRHAADLAAEAEVVDEALQQVQGG